MVRIPSIHRFRGWPRGLDPLLQPLYARTAGWLTGIRIKCSLFRTFALNVLRFEHLLEIHKPNGFDAKTTNIQPDQSLQMPY